MIKMFRYFKWWMWLCVVAIIALIYLQVDFDLQLPDYLGKLGQVIERANQNPSLDPVNEMMPIGFEMLFICFKSILCSLGASLFGTLVGTQLSKILRQKVYDSVGRFSMEEINKFSTASLITRTTNDVQQVQMAFVMILRMAIMAPITAIRGLVKIQDISKSLSIPVGVGVGIIFIAIVIVFIIALPRFKKIQILMDELTLVSRENLTGLRVVRAYNAEEYQQDKINNVTNKITKNNLFVNRVMSVMMPIVDLVMSGMTLAITWLGAYLIIYQNADATLTYQIGAMISYSTRIIMSFMFLVMLFIMVPRAAISAKRINEVIDTKNRIHDPFQSKLPVDDMTGEIEFKNVSFKYPDALGYVLQNITFKAKKGETVAFIGSTGSGKSTLINLIPRFYDISEGEVIVDGINVKDYKQTDLHSLIGYVPQKGILFSGTIASNLRLQYENASDDELWEALEISQAKEFVEALEHKLDSPVSQGGKNFSGGQRQRLCIARAILKKPEIYIFDDSFSALDYKTDKILRKNLKEKTNNATSLIVAQRIGTILYADQIIVLDHGIMIDCGTHSELLKRCNVYQEMAYSQLSKEELENARK